MKHQFKSVLRVAAAMLILLAGGTLLAFGGAYQYLQPALPQVADLRDVRLQMPLRVYSRDRQLIAQIGEQRRIPLSFGELPQQVVNAFLAAEDNDFFHHRGIDYLGLLRATTQHLISGERGQGGGTITMQLARNIFLTPEKTYRRKLLEIFLALRIEREFSKEEILSLYLNKIFLGQRAYGVGAAAEVYFGKTVQELTIDEVALIAGIAQLPSRQNPVASPDRARQRRSYVLERMRANGFISDEQFLAAVDAAIESRVHGPAIEVHAPYVAEMVRQELFNRAGEQVYTAGFEVFTTVDSRMQEAANRAVRTALLEFDQRHGYRGRLTRIERSALMREEEWSSALATIASPAGLNVALIIDVGQRNATAFSRRNGRVNLAWEGIQWARKPLPGGNVGPALQSADQALKVGDVVYIAQRTDGEWQLAQLPQAQGAFVALNPSDGSIAALVGGYDYFTSSFNRAVQAKRQPGSAFKPFLYSAALDQGFTPATVINDAPFVIADSSLESVWRPQNNARRFYGPTRLREALVRSQNLVSIRIMDAIGAGSAIDHIKRFGFSPESLPRNLTLALGTAQVSPLEMARAYAVFANGGFRVEPYFIERVVAPGEGASWQAHPLKACAACWDEPKGQFEVASPLDSAVDVVTAQSVSVNTAQLSAAGAAEQWAPRALSASNAFLMTDMLLDVIKRGTGRRALELQRNDLAGKTGTTNDGRDAWFCGFNSALVGAAWIGFDEERPLGPGEQGARTALPMWIYFMAEALKGVPELPLPVPPGIISMRIAPDTGLPAAAGTADAVLEVFMADHVPERGDIDFSTDSYNDDADREAEQSLF